MFWKKENYEFHTAVYVDTIAYPITKKGMAMAEIATKNKRLSDSALYQNIEQLINNREDAKSWASKALRDNAIGLDLNNIGQQFVDFVQHTNATSLDEVFDHFVKRNWLLPDGSIQLSSFQVAEVLDVTFKEEVLGGNVFTDINFSIKMNDQDKPENIKLTSGFKFDNNTHTLKIYPEEKSDLFDRAKQPFFYTKDLLFTISNSGTRAQIEDIFNQIGKDSFLLLGRLDNSYIPGIVIPDPARSLAKINYDHQDKLIHSGLPTPKIDEASENEHMIIHSFAERLAILNKVGSYVYEKTTGKTSEREEITNKMLSSLFSKNENGHETRDRLKAILFQYTTQEKRDTAFETFRDILIDSSTPAKDIAKAVEDGIMQLPYEVRDSIANISLKTATYLDYSSRDEKTLKKTMSSPKLGSTLLGNIPGEGIVTETLMERMSDFSEEEKTSAILSELKTAAKESYSFIGSAIINGYSRISFSNKRGEINWENSNFTNTVFAKVSDKTELEDTLLEYLHNETPAFPALIDGNYYIVSRRSFVGTNAVGYSITNEDKKAIAKAVDEIVPDDLLGTLYRFASSDLSVTGMRNISNAGITVGKMIGQSEKSVGLQATFSSRFGNTLSRRGRNKKSETKESIDKLSMGELCSSFLSLDRTQKCFPNLLNVDGKDVSAKDIEKNAFLRAYYAYLGERSAAMANIIGVGAGVKIREPFDILDKSKNVLPEEDKKEEMGFNQEGGILDFKHYPKVINLATEEHKKEFFRLAVLATDNTIKDTLGGNHTSVEDALKETLLPKLKEAQYAIMKISRRKNGSIREKAEKFVLVNKDLRAIANTNIPVFAFFKELKNNGFIDKKNTTKEVTFAEKDIHTLFDKTLEVINRDIKSLPDIFDVVKKLRGEVIRNENIERVTQNEAFSPLALANYDEKKLTLFFNSLKKSGLDQIIKDFHLEKLKTPKEIAEEIFDNPKEQAVAIDFLQKKYEGQAYKFSDLKVEDRRIESIQAYFDVVMATDPDIGDNYKVDSEKIKALFETMRGEGSRDIGTLRQAVKLLNTFAFANYVEILKEHKASKGEDLSASDKNVLIKTYLGEVLLLKDSQINDVLGNMALHMKKGIKSSLLGVEMRGGKTRSAIEFANLKNNVYGTSALAFFQGKNFNDILEQGFDSNPLAFLRHSTILGDQKMFVKQSSNMPLAFTEWTPMNIPTKLKRSNLLKNPLMDSNRAPSDHLTREFSQKLSIIEKEAVNISDDDMKNIIAKNKDYISEETAAAIMNGPDTEKGKLLGKVMYFYLGSIVKDGFLDKESENEKVGKEIRSLFGPYWDTYKKELASVKELDGNIVYMGKQYISSHIGSTKNEITIRTKELPPITTGLDVSYAIENKTQLNKADLSSEYASFLDALSLPVKDSKVLLPKFNTFRKPSELKNAYKEFGAIFTDMTNSLYEEIKNDTDHLNSDILADDITAHELARRAKVVTSKIKFSITGADRNLTTDSPYYPIKVDGYAADGIEIDIKRTLETVKDSIGFSPQELKGFDEQTQKEFNNIVEKHLLNHEKIAEALQNASYRAVALELYDPKELKTAVKTRLSPFVNQKNPLKSSTVSFELYFTKNTNMFAPMSPKNIGDPKLWIQLKAPEATYSNFVASSIVLKGSIPSPEDPSNIENKTLYPKHATIDFTTGQKIFVHSLVEDHNAPDSEYKTLSKRFTSNATSGILWSLDRGEERKSHPATMIGDEAHKDVQGNKGEEYQGLVNAIEENEEKPFNKRLTGTPSASGLKKQGELYRKLDPNLGDKVGSELFANCGNIDFKGVILSFIDEEGFKYSNILEEPLKDGVMRAVARISEKGAAANLYDIKEELTDKILNNDEINNALNNYKRSKGVYTSRYEDVQEIEDAIREASRIMLRNIQKEVAVEVEEYLNSPNGKARAALYDDIASFRQTLKEEGLRDKVRGMDLSLHEFVELTVSPGSSLIKPSHGFSNPVGMSYVLDQIHAILVIRRNEHATYINTDAHPTFRKIEDLNGAEKAILRLESYCEKYRNDFKISEFENTYNTLLTLAINGTREHSKALLGMTTDKFNKIVNAEKKTTGKALMDDFKRLMEENTPIPEEKREVFKFLLTSVDHILSQKDTIQKLLRSLEEYEETNFEFYPGKKTKVTTQELKGIQFIIKTPDGEVELGGSAPKADPDKIGKIEKDNFKYASSWIDAFGVHAHRYIDKNDPTRVSTFDFVFKSDFKYRPFPDLPFVETKLNVRSVDDRSILEVAASSIDSSKSMLRDVNEGLSTRIMTTRTAITRFSILEILNALMERSDTSKKQYLLVNPTNDEIAELVQLLNSKEKGYASLVSSKNIEILGVEPSMFNIIAGPLHAKGAGIHYVGNVDSLAEGINMEITDKAHYRGAFKDPEVYTQSLARGIGYNNTVSKYSLYADGAVVALSGNRTSLDPQRVRNTLKEGVVIDSRTSTVSPQTIALPLGSEKVKKAYSVKVNEAREIGFDSYLIYMGGAFPSESKRLLALPEKDRFEEIRKMTFVTTTHDEMNRLKELGKAKAVGNSPQSPSLTQSVAFVNSPSVSPMSL